MQGWIVRLIVVILLASLFTGIFIHEDYQNNNGWTMAKGRPGVVSIGDYREVNISTDNLTIIQGSVNFVDQKGVAVPYVEVNNETFKKLIKKWNISIGYIMDYPDQSRMLGLAFIHSGGLYITKLNYPIGARVEYHNGTATLIYKKPSWRGKAGEFAFVFGVFMIIGSVWVIYGESFNKERKEYVGGDER